ncbi:MAG: response regulator [Helicobacteraceae bacterium]|jgi:signal transduction histidine kinase/CheY-like chemotaxis protein|nr:response regulator [Helicobacteraceae bacterium]
MKYLLTFLLSVLLSSLSAAEAPLHKTIIVGSFLVQDDADYHKKKFEIWAMNHERLKTLQQNGVLHIVSRDSGVYKIVALEPIENELLLNELFEIIRPVYHDAFISTLSSKQLLAAYAKGEKAAQVTEIPVRSAESPSGAKSVEKRASATHKSTVTENPVLKEADNVQEKASSKAVAAKTIEPEDSYVAYTLIVGVVLLAVMVIYLLFRQRKTVSHVKKIEDEITTLNSSYDQLNSTNREYQVSMEEQEGLITEMSGKLKDPAKSILGRTERILKTKLNDKQSIELRNIHDSGQVLFEIVDDLLDFMKIRSNKLEIKEKPFDINELLDIVVRSVLERIEKKDVEVIFDIEKNVPPHIIGDPIRIGQVLTNLLENGIKFTHAGEVKLHVKRLSQTDDNFQLMFEVVDTGVGMLESKLDAIFTPFYQINNNDSAGLGLSISKALVEMMGGEILVATELNRGSTFTFVLGLKEVDAEEKRHYHLPDHAYHSRRILIVDYHDNAATAMKHLLEYFHNDVDIFSHSDLEVMAPDLSKYEMLFISEKLLSFELIKQIDPLKKSNNIKVVVVGSMLHKTNNSHIVDKLADSRIMKPVNQQNIFDLLVTFYGDDEVVKPLQVLDEKESSSSLSMPRIVIERTQKKNVHKDDFVVFDGGKVLVAEDNSINQKVISSLLKESGIEVDMAENGEVAVKMAQNKAYDLVLMDINMPVMNGYEATEHLKSSPKTSGLPIVALSGNTMPEEIAMMKACGMDDRLEKPIKVQALYSVFSKYLELHPFIEDKVESTLPDQLYRFEEALERCGSDKELYKELVGEFIKLYKNSDTLFHQYLLSKDALAMKELSLDIKGVSATIGAYSLANLAQKINESSLASTSMPKYVEAYKKTLHKTLDALTTKMQTL